MIRSNHNAIHALDFIPVEQAIQRLVASCNFLDRALVEANDSEIPTYQMVEDLGLLRPRLHVRDDPMLEHRANQIIPRAVRDLYEYCVDIEAEFVTLLTQFRTVLEVVPARNG